MSQELACDDHEYTFHRGHCHDPGCSPLPDIRRKLFQILREHTSLCLITARFHRLQALIPAFSRQIARRDPESVAGLIRRKFGNTERSL